MLCQSARYAYDVQIPTQELLRLCSKSGALVCSHSELNISQVLDYQHPGTVSTAWDPMLSDLQPYTVYLLRLLAFFDPDGISETFVKSAGSFALEARSHIGDELE